MCTNTHYLYILHANILKYRTAHTKCLNMFTVHLFWVLLLYIVVTTTGQISLVCHRSPPKLRHLSRRGTSCPVLCCYPSCHIHFHLATIFKTVIADILLPHWKQMTIARRQIGALCRIFQMLYQYLRNHATCKLIFIRTILLRN